MPLFYQQTINEHTKLGVWKIAETEAFFLQAAPLSQNIKHPHKRLQHLAGRYLLQYLFPLFPCSEIEITDLRKPYLPRAQYHFSISHCGNYAAAVVSENKSVGIDIELYSEKTEKVKNKFLNDAELLLVSQPSTVNRQPQSNTEQPSTVNCQLSSNNRQLSTTNYQLPTLFWCCKEAVYKWWGLGGIDFRRDILIQDLHSEQQEIKIIFTKKTIAELSVQYILFDELCLAWTIH